ncbi:hypothetical protein PoB_005416600 [Plakobranchus ocellatus]|uniref:Uncharacterized protein n=1 Tax=Plakobranchus ocellatus TaxID=259542 RepID=A0AAV4C8K2_9GAST|nr:hypothetical protein PoB_005416600 [Plakobranchus ocellatus]
MIPGSKKTSLIVFLTVLSTTYLSASTSIPLVEIQEEKIFEADVRNISQWKTTINDRGHHSSKVPETKKDSFPEVAVLNPGRLNDESAITNKADSTENRRQEKQRKLQKSVSRLSSKGIEGNIPRREQMGWKSKNRWLSALSFEAIRKKRKNYYSINTSDDNDIFKNVDENAFGYKLVQGDNEPLYVKTGLAKTEHRKRNKMDNGHDGQNRFSKPPIKPYESTNKERKRQKSTKLESHVKQKYAGKLKNWSSNFMRNSFLVDFYRHRIGLNGKKDEKLKSNTFMYKKTHNNETNSFGQGNVEVTYYNNDRANCGVKKQFKISKSSMKHSPQQSPKFMKQSHRTGFGKIKSTNGHVVDAEIKPWAEKRCASDHTRNKIETLNTVDFIREIMLKSKRGKIIDWPTLDLLTAIMDLPLCKKQLYFRSDIIDQNSLQFEKVIKEGGPLKNGLIGNHLRKMLNVSPTEIETFVKSFKTLLDNQPKHQGQKLLSKFINKMKEAEELFMLGRFTTKSFSKCKHSSCGFGSSYIRCVLPPFKHKKRKENRKRRSSLKEKKLVSDEEIVRRLRREISVPAKSYVNLDNDNLHHKPKDLPKLRPREGKIKLRDKNYANLIKDIIHHDPETLSKIKEGQIKFRQTFGINKHSNLKLKHINYTHVSFDALKSRKDQISLLLKNLTNTTGTKGWYNIYHVHSIKPKQVFDNQSYSGSETTPEQLSKMSNTSISKAKPHTAHHVHRRSVLKQNQSTLQKLENTIPPLSLQFGEETFSNFDHVQDMRKKAEDRNMSINSHQRLGPRFPENALQLLIKETSADETKAGDLLIEASNESKALNTSSSSSQEKSMIEKQMNDILEQLDKAIETLKISKLRPKGFRKSATYAEDSDIIRHIFALAQTELNHLSNDLECTACNQERCKNGSEKEASYFTSSDNHTEQDSVVFSLKESAVQRPLEKMSKNSNLNSYRHTLVCALIKQYAHLLDHVHRMLVVSEKNYTFKGKDNPMIHFRQVLADEMPSQFKTNQLASSKFDETLSAQNLYTHFLDNVLGVLTESPTKDSFQHEGDPMFILRQILEAEIPNRFKFSNPTFEETTKTENKFPPIAFNRNENSVRKKMDGGYRNDSLLVTIQLDIPTLNGSLSEFIRKILRALLPNPMASKENINKCPKKYMLCLLDVDSQPAGSMMGARPTVDQNVAKRKTYISGMIDDKGTSPPNTRNLNIFKMWQKGQEFNPYNLLDDKELNKTYTNGEVLFNVTLALNKLNIAVQKLLDQYNKTKNRNYRPVDVYERFPLLEISNEIGQETMRNRLLGSGDTDNILGEKKYIPNETLNFQQSQQSDGGKSIDNYSFKPWQSRALFDKAGKNEKYFQFQPTLQDSKAESIEKSSQSLKMSNVLPLEYKNVLDIVRARPKYTSLSRENDMRQLKNAMKKETQINTKMALFNFWKKAKSDARSPSEDPSLKDLERFKDI